MFQIIINTSGHGRVESCASAQNPRFSLTSLAILWLQLGDACVHDTLCPGIHVVAVWPPDVLMSALHMSGSRASKALATPKVNEERAEGSTSMEQYSPGQCVLNN